MSPRLRLRGRFARSWAPFALVEDAPTWPPRKEDAGCCAALRDAEGRLRPGYCGPSCIRRPAVWACLGRDRCHDNGEVRP